MSIPLRGNTAGEELELEIREAYTCRAWRRIYTKIITVPKYIKFFTNLFFNNNLLY